MRVNDRALASALIAKGGKLIADYGSFQLIETSTLQAGAANAEPADESDFIELHAARLDTRAAKASALRKATGAFTGKRLHLVQFAGPVKPEWRAALEAAGMRVVHYIPQNAYLVQGDATALAKLQNWAGSSDFVQWEGGYADDYKIHPRARATGANGQPQNLETDLFAVQLVDDGDANAATLALIEQLKLEPVKRQFRALNYLNVIVRLPPERLPEIATRPEVISIQPYFERRKRDERQDQIIAGNLTGSSPSGPGYLAWLASKGFTQAQFTASGFCVDVTDSGIDNGSTTPGHFGLYVSGNPSSSSRVLYSRLEGTANSGSTRQGCDGHGNLNSHIIAGYNDRANGFPHTDATGFHYGLGVCPFVKVGSSVIFDPDTYTYPNCTDLQSRAYRDGARVSANSWGAFFGDGSYDVDAQSYDALVRDAQPSGSAVPNAGNQQMVIVFAAGNDGPSSETVGAPGTAKNIISVGAAENVHSHSTANGGNSASGDDGCITPDSEANSANDVASFSGRGPCADGRKKPDLVAPGTHVTGGVGQDNTNANGTGSALSCFDSTGVCALPGSGTAGAPENFFPLGQQFYTTSSGTSHSTPAVAGACALVRQYFINEGLNAPSPAMTKAFLMNSARYLTGASANDTLPSNNQGMGELNLGMGFDGVPRELRDQLSTDKFTATGQTRTFTGTIADPARPFRVTLAWTDAPGSTTGNAYNNDLDLTITVGGSVYKGNVFSGDHSITGGTADGKNNVESVFLPAGVSGSYTVIVTAANINSDGVPNEAPSLDQDFALVIYNGTTIYPAIISQPQSVMALAGDTANFSVNATGKSPLFYQWQKNGENMSNGGHYWDCANATLTITEVDSNDVANYRCVVTNAYGVTNSASASLALAGVSSCLAVSNADFESGFTLAGGGYIATNWTEWEAQAGVIVGYDETAITHGGSHSQRLRVSGGTNGSAGGIYQRVPVTASQPYTASVWIDAGDNLTACCLGMDLAGGMDPNSGVVWSSPTTNSAWVQKSLTGIATANFVTVYLKVASADSVKRNGYFDDAVSAPCGDNPPSITQQPSNQSVPAGGSASFRVGTTGSNPRSYQWQKDDVNLSNGDHYSGCTTTILTITEADSNDEADYRCAVTNAYGSITSSPAALTLLPNPPPAPVATAATVVTWNSFRANWSSASGATGYRLDVSTNNFFSDFVPAYQDLDVGNVLNRLVTGLNANTTYYYRVRTCNGGGTSEYSETIAVTLATAPSCNPGILVNANFEGSYTDGLAAGWTGYQRAPNPTTVWSIQTASPPTDGGLQYQQIANTSSAGGGGVRQDVTGCTMGATYLISGWMRGNSTLHSTCTVKCSPSASTDWSTAVHLTPAQSVTTAVWTAFSGSVVATGTSMTLWLDGQTSSSGLNKAECFDSITVTCTGIPVPLRFESVIWLESNQVELILSGQPGDSVTIQRSSNLVNWLPLVTLTNTNGALQFIDATAMDTPPQFYRAISP